MNDSVAAINPTIRVFPRYSPASLQSFSVFDFSLGYGQNHFLALTASELSLPNPSDVVSQQRDYVFPQVIAFATACIGIYLGIRLLRSFNP